MCRGRKRLLIISLERGNLILTLPQTMHLIAKLIIANGARNISLPERMNVFNIINLYCLHLLVECFLPLNGQLVQSNPLFVRIDV